MPSTISKSDIQKVMREMSADDMNLDDFIERIVLLSKVRTGLDQKGQGISQEEAMREFGKPRADRKWN
ncbi:MAG: hypothetical protein BMS9Abin05_0248 [Rhodothermia bacterium]|nr:MAG: hypothetical protein BMS9Abin05_0248 [Rhodothermia bacterium]